MEWGKFIADKRNIRNLSMVAAVLAVAGAFVYGWSPDFRNMFPFLAASVFIIIAEWFIVLPAIEFAYMGKRKTR